MQAFYGFFYQKQLFLKIFYNSFAHIKDYL